MSDYPEHDKLQAISERSQAIGEFLDWIAEHDLYCLGQWRTVGDDGSRLLNPHLVPACASIEKLLAEHFEIDLDVIEREKREMLAEIRQGNIPVLEPISARPRELDAEKWR